MTVIALQLKAGPQLPEAARDASRILVVVKANQAVAVVEDWIIRTIKIMQIQLAAIHMVVAQARVEVRPQKEREGVKIGKLIVIVLCNPVMPVNKVMRYQHLATSRTTNCLLKHLCLSLVKGESGEPSKPAAHKQWNVPYTNFNAQH